VPSAELEPEPDEAAAELEPEPDAAAAELEPEPDAAAAELEPEPDAAPDEPEPEPTPLEAWEKEFATLKLHWVVVVSLFWVSILVMGGLFLIRGAAYITEIGLLAAIFGVVGVQLKTKVLLLKRKKPAAQQQD